MGIAVIADNPGTVNSQHNMRPLKRRVMQYLVKAALEKGRINRKHRNKSLDRKSGRKSYCVLLRNPDIKKPAATGFGKRVQPGSDRHGSGNRADFWVLAQFDHLRPEYSRKAVAGRSRFSIRRPGLNIKLTDSMISRRIAFCKGIPLAFHRLYLYHCRPFKCLCTAQYLFKLLNVVSIYRAKIFQPHLFKKGIMKQNILEYRF